MTFIVEFLSHKIALVLLFAFVICPIGVIYGIAKKRTIISFLSFILLGLMLFNFFMGSRLTSSIINKNGALGTAIVTGTEGTGNYYNNVESIEYKVLLKTAENETLETSFQSQDPNFYPRPKEDISLPEVGMELKVKYLPDAPKHFIILLNEGDNYAKKLECDDVLSELNGAEQKMNFDKTNEIFKNEYERLQKAYTEKDCI